VTKSRVSTLEKQRSDSLGRGAALGSNETFRRSTEENRRRTSLRVRLAKLFWIEKLQIKSEIVIRALIALETSTSSLNLKCLTLLSGMNDWCIYYLFFFLPLYLPWTLTTLLSLTFNVGWLMMDVDDEDRPTVTSLPKRYQYKRAYSLLQLYKL
jgi:hypothetical protein